MEFMNPRSRSMNSIPRSRRRAGASANVARDTFSARCSMHPISRGAGRRASVRVSLVNTVSSRPSPGSKYRWFSSGFPRFGCSKMNGMPSVPSQKSIALCRVEPTTVMWWNPCTWIFFFTAMLLKSRGYRRLLVIRLREFTGEPCACEPPVAHYCLRRDLQHPTGFLNTQSTKKTELDHLRSSRIELLQRIQGFVQGADLRARRRRLRWQIIEIDRGRVLRAGRVPASLDCRARPCRVDQNPPHDSRTHGEEMRPIGPIEVTGVDQPQKRFVDERRWLQCVLGALVPHIGARHAVQLLIDKRRQVIQGRGISAPPRLQQTGDFRRRSWARH